MLSLQSGRTFPENLNSVHSNSTHLRFNPPCRSFPPPCMLVCVAPIAMQWGIGIGELTPSCAVVEQHEAELCAATGQRAAGVLGCRGSERAQQTGYSAGALIFQASSKQQLQLKSQSGWVMTISHQPNPAHISGC